MGEVKITPPLGGAMAGFSARKGVSQGVHDDLYARALVVEGQETSSEVLGHRGNKANSTFGLGEAEIFRRSIALEGAGLKFS